MYGLTDSIHFNTLDITNDFWITICLVGELEYMEQVMYGKQFRHSVWYDDLSVLLAESHTERGSR